MAAQRKRFDAFIDKAATKEDSEELKRGKKRVRFEEQDTAPEKSDVDDKVQTETAPNDSSSTEAPSSSGSKSSSSTRGPIEDAEDPETGLRFESNVDKREQKTKIHEEFEPRFESNVGKRECQRMMAVQTWTRQQQRLDQKSP